MKIWILFLFLIPITSAFNISVNYPDSVCTGEEFEISVDLINSTNVYDFKIDLFGDGRRVSRIWNGEEWRSTMYYVAGSKNFRLIVPEYVGDIDMGIKLRNEEVFVFSGYELESVECAELEIEDRGLEYEEDEEKRERKDKEREEKIREFEREPLYVKQLEPIVLTPQTIKTKKNSQLEDKGYSKYLILVFCIVLLVLYIKNPRKKKNEFI